jgi:hypothetical protein
MAPINVAIYHRGDEYRWNRIDGQFSYPVDGLKWTQHALSKSEQVKLASVEDDVVWLDEGKYRNYKLFTPEPGPGRPVPVVYYALYPTLAQDIYKSRVQRAKKHADAVLVEHDDLERWERDTGLPCRRLAYSVNEQLYRDRGQRRDIDVGYYCVYAFNSERPALDAWLADYCKRKDYSFQSTGGENVGVKYAELLARTKVVVHMTRTPKTRPPRIFDTAASGAALLSNPMPDVSGERWEPWVHYVPFNKPRSVIYQPFTGWKPMDDGECAEIAHGLAWLLDEGHWAHVAERAREYVLARHTWARRAVELRGILCDLFPELREKAGTEWMYS